MKTYKALVGINFPADVKIFKRQLAGEIIDPADVKEVRMEEGETSAQIPDIIAAVLISENLIEEVISTEIKEDTV